jgi:branched-chain amino acid transport system ATP-binding protein
VTPTASAALTLRAVTRDFGGLRAVDGVTLTVAAGEKRALIGPNGAGKTTLFSLISGEQPVSAGAIQLFGRDVTGLPPHRRAALGLSRTYQITNLFPRLPVRDNCVLAVQALRREKLHLHRSLHRYPEIHARAAELLDSVGLADKAGVEARRLSYGEQRQLEIALALAGSPRVLLLDEPTAGLSPLDSQRMTALLKRLDPAITLVVIEHDMDVAFALTDRVTVLHYGKVLADGRADEVRANPLVQEIYLGAM